MNEDSKIALTMKMFLVKSSLTSFFVTKFSLLNTARSKDGVSFVSFQQRMGNYDSTPEFKI